MKALKITLLSIVSSCLFFSSCVDADIDEAVDYKDFYQTVDDADAAILGLYGKFMELAGPVVVLNELRGDLMDITPNASRDLQQINQHNVTADNKWSDATQFYNIIQNCNDMLVNFMKMKNENKLTEDEFNERYSDVGAIRTWVYLQLAVQYGDIPYITEPIVDFRDLDEYKDQVLSFDVLLDSLINFMNSLPTLENYQNSKLVDTEASIDEYSLIPFFINKKCLLGDLYLFDNQYHEAATYYREILRTGESAAVNQNENNMLYRIYCWPWTAYPAEVNYFQILYPRYKPEDASEMYNAWKQMFSRPADDRYVKYEMIWEMSFDYRFAPAYPFIELFSDKGKGEYLLKPSTYAVNNIWGAETQINGFPFDARGMSGAFEESSSGDYVITKYSYGYDDVHEPYQQDGKWFLYRAALLHLRYAEAVNRAGYPRLAWALVNDGIKGEAFLWRHEDGTEYRFDSIRVSAWGPGINFPPPYDFDARENTSVGLRGPWRAGGGIRGRASLPNKTLENLTTKEDSIMAIEQMIVREAALELGFEGHRWTDLIRVARRLDNPNELRGMNGNGSEFLNSTLRGKYEMAGSAAPTFSSQADWYLELYE